MDVHAALSCRVGHDLSLLSGQGLSAGLVMGVLDAEELGGWDVVVLRIGCGSNELGFEETEAVGLDGVEEESA